ncbi:MAG: hypothetical protein KIS92_17805 [Planctomycetota bacterium]|nr:hypothetical protein [Planctomycetota bacterium]
MTLSKGMCLAVVLAGLAGTVRAETEEPVRPKPAPEGERTEQEFRYDFKVLNGVLVKVDRKTGHVTVVNPGGAQKEADPVTLSSDQPRAEEKRNRKPIILTINGESVETEDREEASRDIADYAGQIGISQALQVDSDRVSGLVRVTNNGKRRLAALELTLYVPVASNKTVEHRIVMKDARGFESVPPPEKAGSALNKVEFNAPEIVKGQLEIKITYIKFAD